MEETTVFTPNAVQNQQPQPQMIPQPQLQQAPVAPPPMQAAPPQVPPPQQVAMPQPPGSKNRLLMLIGGIVGAIILLVLVIKLISGMHGSSEKITLVYWGLWEDPKVMNTIFDEFHRQNPNITIDYKKRDINQYKDSLITQISGGSGPDLFRFHSSWTPTLTKVLLPLSSEVISPSDFKRSYYPVVLNDLVRSGAIYGIPLEIDTLALYYNKAIFASAGLTPPTTWNEVASVAANLTVEDGNGDIQTAGIALGTFDNITHAPDVASLLFLLQGIPLKKTDSQGSYILPSYLATNSAQMVDVLNYYTDFSNGQKYVDRKVWDGSLPQSKTEFESGSLAMYFGYSWDMLDLAAAAPDLPYGVVPVPSLFGKKTTIASYWAEGVSAQSKHKKEALQLMHFLTEKDTLQKLYAAEKASGRPFGEPYPRSDMADLMKSDPMLAPFVQLAPVAGSSFFAADTYDTQFSGTLNTYLGNAISSLQPGGSTSPDSAVGTLTAGIRQVFHQYGIQ
jgi:multiple sugar transport system substrate-binding protein